MTQVLSDGRFRVSALAAACFVALATAGCGGGSSGGSSSSSGGNGSVELTDEQQAALAARSAASTANFAQGFAEERAIPPDPDDDDDNGNDDNGDDGSGVGTASAPVAMSLQQVGLQCANEGGFLLLDDEDTTLDIADSTFPAPFTNANSVSGSRGDVENIIVRADCAVEDGEGNLLFRQLGSTNILQLVDVDGNDGSRITHYRTGGLTGPGLDDLPNLDEAYVSESGGAGFDIGNTVIQGEMFICEGCADGGNLAIGNLDGNPERDAALSAWFEMELAFEDGPFTLGMGTGPDDPFTLTSRFVQPFSQIDVNGRLAATGTDNGCDFDVTYETHESLLIANFDTGGDDIQGGSLTITVNDSGTSYDVLFDNLGNTTITDGQGQVIVVDDSELEDLCADDDFDDEDFDFDDFDFGDFDFSDFE